MIGDGWEIVLNKQAYLLKKYMVRCVWQKVAIAGL